MIDEKKLVEIVGECIEDKVNVGVTMSEMSAALATLSTLDPSTKEIEEANEDLIKRMNKIIGAEK